MLARLHRATGGLQLHDRHDGRARDQVEPDVRVDRLASDAPDPWL